MKLSVSSYSFRQAIVRGSLTQFDCVQKAKEMGFDGIEFTDLDGRGDLECQKEQAVKIAEEAERLGIEVNAYTIDGCMYQESQEKSDAEVERLKGQLEVAKLLGVNVLRHDVCYELTKTGNGRSFDLMLPVIAENTRRVTGYAETLGIRTCSENHGLIAQDSGRVERLFHAVNHDNFGLLVDIGNFACVDEDSALAVSRVAPYAFHVHVKDMRIRPEPMGECRHMTRGGRYLCGTVVGEGDIPVKRCLNILKASGYEGYLSIEYEGTEDCFAGITRGLSNLKRILEELEW